MLMEETERVRKRPVFARYLRRLRAEENGYPLRPPTNEEIHDAVKALSEPALPHGMPDPVLSEALRIIEEWRGQS